MFYLYTFIYSKVILNLSFLLLLNINAILKDVENQTVAYIRNLRRSPSWELRTASPRGRYGERYTHATMQRGVQANFTQKTSTKPALPG